MGQPVIQFEIAGQNGSKLREFYGFLFDWKIDKSDPAGLSNVRTGGRSGIDGAIREEENGPVEITVYVQVSDLEATLVRVEKLGGKTIVPPTSSGDKRWAQFEDPEGHVIGLVQG
jgi:predicted enzyme related to lactoylglutathione lyase